MSWPDCGIDGLDFCRKIAAGQEIAEVALGKTVAVLARGASIRLQRGKAQNDHAPIGAERVARVGAAYRRIIRAPPATQSKARARW